MGRKKSLFRRKLVLFFVRRISALGSKNELPQRWLVLSRGLISLPKSFQVCHEESDMWIALPQPQLALSNILELCRRHTIKTSFIFAEHKCQRGLQLMRRSPPDSRVSNSARVCCTPSFVLSFNHGAAQVAARQSCSGRS